MGYGRGPAPWTLMAARFPKELAARGGGSALLGRISRQGWVALPRPSQGVEELCSF